MEEAFRDQRGEQLSTAEIKKILKNRYPGMKEGSMLPNDHGEGNKTPCWCAATERRLFDRVSRGQYRVR